MFSVSIRTALIVLMLTLTGGKAAERPVHMGTALAYPLTYAETLPQLRFPDIGTGMGMSLTLKVGVDGRVVEISPQAGTDSSLFDLYRPFFDGLRFEPGLKDGVPVRQTIPLSVWCNAIRNESHLGFPVDTSLEIRDPKLYALALRDNGAGTASLRRFPSYFYVPQASEDSTADLQYLLVSAKLSRGGKVTGVNLVNDPSTSFTGQVLSAINWAEFEPAQGPDGPVSSEIFLGITLFPGAVYPTRVIEAGQDDLELLERLRVFMVPDTVGLMCKPVPRRVFLNGAYAFPDGPIRDLDTIGAVVKISDQGIPIMCNAMGADRVLGDRIRKFVANLRFYPARDFSGTTHPFEGLMRFECVTSTEIRIRFCWLDGEGF